MRQQGDKMSENKHSIIFASFPSTAGETHSPGGLERGCGDIHSHICCRESTLEPMGRGERLRPNKNRGMLSRNW